MNHTPTPWKVRPYNKEKKGLAVVYVNDPFDKRGYKDIGTTTKLDAAFIVRAVNAHEELLGASKELIGFLKKPMDLRAEKDLEEILLRLNQAIAKAEGK